MCVYISAGPFRGHQAARREVHSTVQMSTVVLQVLLSWLSWDVFEVFSDLLVRSLLDAGKLIRSKEQGARSKEQGGAKKGPAAGGEAL